MNCLVFIPFCYFSNAMCFLVSLNGLLVVMPLAVVVAAVVAINDGAVEEHRQHLLHGKFWSASVDADAQLVQHVNRPLTQSTAKHIGAALFGQEPRHRTVFMFGCLQHL